MSKSKLTSPYLLQGVGDYNMKLKRVIAVFVIALIPQVGWSFDFYDYVAKYALPCGTSLIAGAIGASIVHVPSNQGTNAGLMGCSLLVIGGEMVANKTVLSDAQTKKIDEIITAQLDQNRKMLRRDYDDQILHLSEKVDAESIKNKEVVKNVIGNVAVMMEEEIMKKIQSRLKTMDVVPELREAMKIEVKDEVLREIKNRSKDFEDEIIQKVIDRIVVEKVRVEKDEANNLKRVK